MDYRDGAFALAILGLLLAIILGVAVYGASVEASTFNRLTGSDLTTWEALWVNARIDCN